MPRFAANLTLLFNEVPFAERFAAAAAAGFRAVEYLFPYDHPPMTLRNALQEHGLQQVLHNLPAGNWEAGERGIACLVRNRHLAGGVGELPPNEVWPQLWVTDDDDIPAAERLIEELLGLHAEPAPDWRCPRCGETIEGQFAACWNCGAEAPG